MQNAGAQIVGEIMTKDPVTMPQSASVREAAQVMRDRSIGDVIVVEDRESQRITGIVTDRDIVVRAVAEGYDPDTVSLADVQSAVLTTVTEDTPIQQAIDLMMKRSVRRLPVVRETRPVGVVAIGDLAVERDPGSVLGQISAAEPNS
jgi:CBS domain-containing protein